MKKKAEADKIYAYSKEIVARDVQGEFVIIPVSAQVDGEDFAIFSLNPTGLAVWKNIDGKRTLAGVIKKAAAEFDADEKKVEKDVLKFVETLLERKMLVEAGRKR
ncbi:MAG: PqqD family protein [Candidatus Omnitrophota bacterium]|jgi:hypothetical protein